MPESMAGAVSTAATTARLHQWLTGGRVQSSSGAFCAWRDMSRDEMAFEYPEITGYALTWLAADARESERALATGTRAAEWLLQRLGRGDRSARSGWEAGAVYTFDLGMIAAGLMSFGRATGDPRPEQVGGQVAASLARYLEQTGELPALAPDGPAGARHGQWSTDGRAHLVKCVQALLLSDNQDAAGHLVEQAYAEQADDGHFVTQPGDAFVMLHPHLYAVEGLWMWGTAVGESDSLHRARHATEWAWRQQLPSGGLPRWTSGAQTGPEQLDATSQAVRAAVILGLAPEGLDRAIDRLTACVTADGDHGSALVYRPNDLAHHLNTWVTMFGEQALRLAGGKSDALDWRHLV